MIDANEPINMDTTEFGTMGGQYGLTKREYFAAMAMQGMMNNANWITDIELVSERATVFADALINSLNQPI